MVFEYFSEGKRIVGRVLWLSIINALLSLLSISELIKVITFRGIHYGLKVTLPKPVPLLWDFVSLPKVNAYLLPLPLSILLGYLIIVFQSFIIGGYLGTILCAVKGTSKCDFLDYSKRYFKSILGYSLLWYTLIVILITFPSSPLVIALIILYFVIYYFIYATPFIIVSQSLDLKRALSLSVEVAKEREFLCYTLTYALVTLMISIPLTVITVNGKFGGIMAGLLFSSVPALWLSASTMVLIVKVVEKTT